MNKLATYGLGAAAVVVALVIGTQALGPSAPPPGDVGSAPSASPWCAGRCRWPCQSSTLWRDDRKIASVNTRQRIVSTSAMVEP